MLLISRATCLLAFRTPQSQSVVACELTGKSHFSISMHWDMYRWRPKRWVTDVRTGRQDGKAKGMKETLNIVNVLVSAGSAAAECFVCCTRSEVRLAGDHGKINHNSWKTAYNQVLQNWNSESTTPPTLMHKHSVASLLGTQIQHSGLNVVAGECKCTFI